MPAIEGGGMAKKSLPLTRSVTCGLTGGRRAAPLPQCPMTQQPGRTASPSQFGQHFLPAVLAFAAGPDIRAWWGAGVA
ncbi:MULTISPECIES: hypothetical protein [Acetobacterales]|uniref:Uncharacterized protein n=1 Tax=Teichococcus rhizosphaerae TaxID=1335062 RepID=A0A2C7A372_9PROT|nr:MULTISPECIES: hypothetical protein [Acetobacteraceae]MBS5904786.1 hypothetical protein [Acetobacteraceae bacterium]MDT8312713.1 hypothetical protein [Roseomonas mucosa]MDT8351199.1 hypothetical protein [Roseomonas mucosa]MDT8360134.1 hypothetical protein [Roseomonas mucosa]PHK94518.1 hypothetical protein CR162_12580 [Pseudoroseomonas rhizosphaerae]